MALAELSFTAWQSGVLLSAGILVYLVVLTVYRVFLHPLAGYPGPFLSKVTSFSVYLQAVRGDRHLIHLREHQKYGPIVRIAPNQLSFASPSALRQIYQSQRANNPLRKSPWYETIDAPSGAYSTHTEISRTKHAFRRRVLDHAFSDSSLRSAETFVIENTETLCKVLAADSGKTAAWSKSFNMSDMCTYLAYDIMGDLVFGKSFNTLTAAAHRFVPKLLMASTAFMYPTAHLPFQSIVRPIICSETLMTWFGGELARDEHRYVQYANDRVKERLDMEKTSPDEIGADDKDLEASTEAGAKNAKERKDMMHYMLHARDPVSGRPFTRQDLDAESSLLIAAGADTTSTTLAATFFYLTLDSSKPVLKELQDQLRSQFETVDSIKSPQIVQHTYLRAVIDEVLRLAPPLPTHLARMVVQPGGLEVAGEIIPKGTIVGCPAYVLHHNESAFPDSFAFKPERWISSPIPGNEPPKTHLKEASELQWPEQVAKAKEAFCSFSLGSRGCVGKSLAYLELCVSLGRVLWQFDIRRAEGSEGVSVRSAEEGRKRGWRVRDDEFQLRDCFLAEREGPMVEFKQWKGQ